MASSTCLPLLLALAVCILCSCSQPEPGAKTTPSFSKLELGRKLFNDKRLSRDGQQACASCHSAAHAFIDPRPNRSSHEPGVAGAFSLGQDNQSLGDINTPSAAYLRYAPDFYFDQEEQVYKGGFFLNGRAASLQDQATQPFLNPVEMQATAEQVVSKVKASYGQEMKALYGDNIFADGDKAFAAIADAIVRFESSPEFSPFDSKFDRVLRGEASFTELEAQGKELFIAEDKGNCAACHPVPEKHSPKAEQLFTDFTYDNLGLPANTQARQHNGKQGHKDNGLYDNPRVDDEALKGAFRVPSLRNVAVTAPYMHNGVFNDLKTVVKFYNDRDVAGAINPETGQPWRQAEVAATVNKEELGDLGLTDQEMGAIVAFMQTLTDKRYEGLGE